MTAHTCKTFNPDCYRCDLGFDEALHGAIDELYDYPGCSTGGPLHIVTDDGNVKDAHLEFCEEQLGEWPTDVQETAYGIIDLLRSVHLNRREELIEGYWSATVLRD